jgi:hypothetical protein
VRYWVALARMHMHPRLRPPAIVARQYREARESCSSAACPQGHCVSGGVSPFDGVVMRSVNLAPDASEMINPA